MISVVILVKNEEKHIIDCIESVMWADEIVVIDTGSEDRTRELIDSLHKKHIHVYTHEFMHDFATARNFGLNKATAEWILFLDADERVSVSLQYEILSVINSTIDNFAGFFIKRRDILWGRSLKYGEAANISLLRLAKQDAGKWEGKVHETWKVKGKTGVLQNELFHYPHDNLTEFLQKINFYTDIRAKELHTKKVKLYWWQLFVYPTGKFVQNYFIKRGFLDGNVGMVHALLMSLHSFLVRGKLWQLWQKKV